TKSILQYRSTRKVVYRPLPLTERGGRLDSLLDEPFRTPDTLLQSIPLRQTGRNSRRKRAAGPMRSFRKNALSRKRHAPVLRKKHVDWLPFRVPALDQNRLAAQIEQPPSSLRHILGARQSLGL